MVLSAETPGNGLCYGPGLAGSLVAVLRFFRFVPGIDLEGLLEVGAGVDRLAV